MTIGPRSSPFLRPGLLRAFLGAVLGAVVGVGILLLANATINLDTQPGHLLGLGYIGAFFGFLLGIGAFRFWLTWASGRDVNQAEEHAAHGTPGDWRRYFAFTTDHKVIGVQYLVTAFALFVVAGSAAMLAALTYGGLHRIRS